MKPAPDVAFWLALLAWLAGQTLLVVAPAGGIACVLRSHAWRRTIWHAAFVSLGLVLVAELAGVIRRLTPRLAIRPTSLPHFAARGSRPVTVVSREPAVGRARLSERAAPRASPNAALGEPRPTPP